uniref:NADH dehydrogenase subunit 4 n=1 Tax=Antithamnionella miharai TaxID=536589 RepID=UPI002E76E2C2|nr:NADH dehydrogenase subunit 4 [Antithamnionella miharai]WQF69346.1 NADH dehydrogenase subunit 4 [Antithamnionella miharai]WQF69371.1 NADH dehydrogenase subunit 4 [Antithamnionella miharai]
MIIFYKMLNPLLLTSLTPLIGIFFVLLLPRERKTLLLNLSLSFTCLTFLFSLFLWFQFDSGTSFFQFKQSFLFFPNTNLIYSIGIDGISLFLILLTTLLINICILTSWTSVKFYLKEYLICFLTLEFCLIQVFAVLDLLLFYIFFESVLIPMFLIIGIWGSRVRKIRAAYQFFLYTLTGSLLMLIGIIFIYLKTATFDIQILEASNFSIPTQYWLWLAFFASFAVKIPMVPFHIWLPEAHAEAPTAGSVILAGVLLKLGGYGFIRFSIPLFPEASIYFSPLVFTLSTIAIVYASLTTLRQVDLKKIIAYSSVSHMGFVTIGIFSLNTQGIEGSLILMLSHGLVSSALFLCVGVLYDRHKTRIIKYYAGLVKVMPLFICLFVYFSFANIGFPGTSSFIGELLVLIGVFQLNSILTMFVTSGVILSAAYSIWLLNRISFGNLKLNYFTAFQDISRREFWIILPLVILVCWMGVHPNSFLAETHFSILSILEHLNI